MRNKLVKAYINVEWNVALFVYMSYYTDFNVCSIDLCIMSPLAPYTFNQTSMKCLQWKYQQHPRRNHSSILHSIKACTQYEEPKSFLAHLQDVN